jgi:hypothetical protein
MKRSIKGLFATLLVPGMLLTACKGKESPKSPDGGGQAVEQGVLPAGPFEGVMYMTTTIPGEAKEGMKSEMKLFISQKGVRTESTTDIPGQAKGIRMIMISPADTPKKVYMINEAAGSCMEIDLSKATAKEVDEDPFKDAKIENLGNERVNGYNCTHVRITRPGKEETMEFWVTRDMLDYFTYARMQASRDKSMPKLAQRLKDAGLDGFPVRVVIKPAGIVTELTKVERGAVDEALFKVPANCTRFEVPAVGPGGMSKEKIKEMQDFAKKMQQQMKQQ